VLPAFVIGLREGLETVVIIGAIALFLRAQQRLDVLRRVWCAGALAAAICVVVAFVIRLVEVNLPWRQQEQLETVVGLAAVLMVTYMVVWMRRFPKDLRRESGAAAASAFASDSGRALVVLAFLAVLREGFEIAVFVIATIGMTGGNAWEATGGAFLGIAAALAVGFAVVRGSTRLDVARFFRLTALVLVLSAAGIAMSTVHTANAAGWITFGQTPQFDLYWLAPPGSVLSSFTTGMFGLQPYPVLIEVVTWLAYLVPMTAVVLWPRSRPLATVAPPLDPIHPPVEPAAPPVDTVHPPVGAAGAASSAQQVGLGPPPRLALLRRMAPWPTVVALVVVAVLLAALVAHAAISATTAEKATPKVATQRAVAAKHRPAPSRRDGIDARKFAPSIGSRPLAGSTRAGGAKQAVHSPAGRPSTASLAPVGAAATAARRSRILFASLDAVSCSSALRCIAVGDFLPVDKDAASGDPDGDGHATHTLVESSGGGRWSIVTSPDEGHGGAVLSAVSCPSAQDCTAVGYYIPSRFPLAATKAPPSYPLVESDDGRGWAIVASPQVAPNSVLQGVSCPSVSDCVAVGYTATSSPSGASVESFFVEVFDGTSWRAVALRAPAGTSSGLSSVSCPDVSSCVAVGNVAPASNPATTQPLIEELDNGTWTRAVLPRQVDGPGILYKVSCARPGRCIAVGSTESTRSSGAALVLVSNGSTWSANPAALAQAGDISLTTVACAGTSDCLVSGLGWTSLDAAPDTVLARVDATSWHSLDAASISGDVENLACPAASRCVAVGSVPQNTFGNTLALIDRLSDGTWTAEHSPLP
jgi:high-affinity iron transporter